MSDDRVRRTLVRLFGEDGDVAAEPELQAMTVGSAIVVTGEILISPLISDLAGVFGVTESTAGLLMVAIAAPQIAVVPIVGVVADRIGRRAVLVPGLLLFGVAGGAVAVAETFQTVVALRVVQGIGFAATMPLTITVFGDLYEGSREATAQGLRQAGINVVWIVSPVIAGALFLASWWYPFGVFLLAIPVGVWAWTVLPDAEPVTDRSLRTYLGDLVALFRKPPIGFTLVSFVLRFVLLFAFLTYVSVLAVRAGMAVVVIGGLLSIKGALSFLSATQGGRITTIRRPTTALVGGFALAGGGMAVSGLYPTPATIIVGTVLFGIGDGIVPPVQKSLLNRLVPGDRRAGAMATATTLQNVGKVIGPMAFVGLLSVVDSSEAFVVLGAVGGGIGVLVVLAIRQANG